MTRKDIQALIALPISLAAAAGLAYVGSEGGHSAFGLPIFVLCVALIFLIQWLAFAPAYIQQTERYYDLTGSLTFLSALVLAVALNPFTDWRGWLLVGLIALWAVRLGAFLFQRVHKTGEDRRFRELKPSLTRFLLAWTLQGLWVSFSLGAALAAITAAHRVALGAYALLGLILWVAGFAIEVVADRQKQRFKADPKNQGRFIQTGLWAWSRHPNYFGEIVLWLGIAVIAFPALAGWQLVTLVSPIFIVVLLTRISGIPLLEKRADELWGGQSDYEAYKAITPVLIPRRPHRS
ncbi:MAG: DUF1295 domain-containing protein [Chloroflexi bacterium]|nr:DUF1295 domain-containing protein [Chloroflexota bacterium]